MEMPQFNARRRMMNDVQQINQVTQYEEEEEEEVDYQPENITMRLYEFYFMSYIILTYTI